MWSFGVHHKESHLLPDGVALLAWRVGQEHNAHDHVNLPENAMDEPMFRRRDRRYNPAPSQPKTRAETQTGTRQGDRKRGSQRQRGTQELRRTETSRGNPLNIPPPPPPTNTPTPHMETERERGGERDDTKRNMIMAERARSPSVSHSARMRTRERKTPRERERERHLSPLNPPTPSLLHIKTERGEEIECA
jgi:hypothetical protein